MSLIYCERWNERLCKPIGRLGADEAKVVHESGEPYAVASVDEGTGHADRVVELAMRSNIVRVNFLDEYNRVEMIYIFGPADGRLFLQDITTYDYGDVKKYLGMSRSRVVEINEFNPDGTGVYHYKGPDERYSQELSLKDDRSLDLHWEAVPEFGDYASIARGKRSGPAVPFG
ncbi:hypothetical protein ACQEVS_08715 [Streptomyces sp. CA-181903]|uniref:hypothetical protein n=1 Tax=Streptomyces sp. CA-181903 TaxID=3240055 RepID=UPI003D8D6274